MFLTIGGIHYLISQDLSSKFIFGATGCLCLFLLLQVLAKYILDAIVIFAFTIIALSPYVLYGMRIDETLYFGSAYSVDTQQYLSVAFSLANHGLPFKNPYWPDVEGFYHYGYMVPLAAAIKFLSLETTSFFNYSHLLFGYIAITVSFVFLCIRIMFFQTTKSAMTALAIGFLLRLTKVFTRCGCFIYRVERSCQGMTLQ